MAGTGDHTELAAAVSPAMLVIVVCLAAAHVTVTVLKGWKRYTSTYVVQPM